MAEESTRDRIIEAAHAILSEGESRPSVRAVAARAGIGASTLRHHFPSQRHLLDAVVDLRYARVLTDGRIHDRSIAPVQRLTECLSQVLGPIGEGAQARQLWRQVWETFIDADPQMDTVYAAMARSARDRIVGWLRILAIEGVVVDEHLEARADHLLTVVNGLALQRALPVDPGSRGETAILQTAIQTALSLPVTWGIAVDEHVPSASGPEPR